MNKIQFSSNSSLLKSISNTSKSIVKNKAIHYGLGAAAGTSVGVFGGMAAGAVVGSVVPGLGTFIGMGAGAIVGALGGGTIGVACIAITRKVIIQSNAKNPFVSKNNLKKSSTKNTEIQQRFISKNTTEKLTKNILKTNNINISEYQKAAQFVFNSIIEESLAKNTNEQQKIILGNIQHHTLQTIQARLKDFGNNIDNKTINNQEKHKKFSAIKKEIVSMIQDIDPSIKEELVQAKIDQKYKELLIKKT